MASLLIYGPDGIRSVWGKGAKRQQGLTLKSDIYRTILLFAFRFREEYPLKLTFVRYYHSGARTIV